MYMRLAKNDAALVGALELVGEDLLRRPEVGVGRVLVEVGDAGAVDVGVPAK